MQQDPKHLIQTIKRIIIVVSQVVECLKWMADNWSLKLPAIIIYAWDEMDWQNKTEWKETKQTGSNKIEK